MKRLIPSRIALGRFTTYAVRQIKPMYHSPGVIEFGISDGVNIAKGVPTSFETRTIRLDVPMLAKYNAFNSGHHSVCALEGVTVSCMLSAKPNGVVMNNPKKYATGALSGAGIPMPIPSHIILRETKYGYDLTNTSHREDED